MSIARTVTRVGDEAGKRLVPVAPEALFRERVEVGRPLGELVPQLHGLHPIHG